VAEGDHPRDRTFLRSARPPMHRLNVARRTRVSHPAPSLPQRR
jgi:hypothetical protein